MREGWEIRKLGDLTTALNGLWVGKKPPFVNIAVIRNTNFTKDCRLDTTDIAYIDAEVKHFSTRKLQCGDIIIEKSGGSDKQPVGRPVLFNIPEGDFSYSNFTSTLRINDQSVIIPSFLHKVLWAIHRSGKTASLQSKTTGIRNLDFKSYLKLPIPVPSIAEQEKIVAELDTLSEVIAKKKQQLEELDKLAQSIFYDMFGDPITNKKGWEVRKLGSVCSSMVRGPFGSALKKEFFVPQSSTTYKIYEQKHAIQKDATIGSYYITEDLYRELSRFEVKPGDIIMSCSGTIGELYSLPKHAERGIINQALLKFSLNRTILEPYFLFIMRVLRDTFETKGSGIANIGSVKYIKNTDIALPPLSLQNLFSQKIEAIEKQKELVKRSIAETETLFNSRMDYWFNN